MGILSNENAISGGNYQIANSLRFQNASTQYATRTPASTTNVQKFTWSGWVKRGALGQYKLFGAATGAANTWYIMYGDNINDALTFGYFNGTNAVQVTTAPVYRDPSAWYHVVIAIDTTQATAANRVLMYVNGVQVTSFATATYPTLNQNTLFNSNTAVHYLGATSTNTSGLWDGYMAEVNFIDGQALTPSSFGSTDPTSGQWVAAKYTGTYGTNGFYLPFSNGTSTTTLGADSSGNSNNWTLTNFTRSAGVSDCWMYDVPSGNGGASDTQPSSNYSIINPNDKGTSLTVYASNLGINQTGAIVQHVRGSIYPISGKWYFEVTAITNSTSGNLNLGIATNQSNLSGRLGGDAYSWSYVPSTIAGNNFWNNGTSSGSVTDVTTGTYGVAYDADNGKLWFRNGSGAWIGGGDPAAGTSPNFTGVLTGASPSLGMQSGTSVTLTAQINNGQRSFAYTPPTGFKAVCTANLPVATIKQGNKYMDATLYSGNGSTQTITNAGGFKPDLVWIKSRTAATDHKLTDSVRGVQKGLISDTTGAETIDTNGLTAFNSNGWSLGTDTVYNANAGAFVGWQWQAGQGSTSSNTNGSITSTTSVNATAGFSVVTYTGTGANATVGHGLGVAPKMVICKSRSVAAAWDTYHVSVGAGAALFLNQTNAAGVNSAYWNNTSPTSTVFSLGTGTDVNANGSTNVAYCFAEIAGFSKFGSYTGNGSADGTFIYLGFQPKFILLKCISTVGNWIILDTIRNSYNVFGAQLYPNLSNAEAALVTLDVLSNGFKLRNTIDPNAAQTYIYMAFASNPFQNSNAY